MLPRVVCQVCCRMFRPKRQDAKYCGEDCRRVANVHPHKPAEWLSDVPVMDDFEHEVVMAAESDETFEELATDVIYRRKALVRSARMQWEATHGPVAVCDEDEVDDGY